MKIATTVILYKAVYSQFIIWREELSLRTSTGCVYSETSLEVSTYVNVLYIALDKNLDKHAV